MLPAQSSADALNGVELETEVLRAVNRERQARGKSPLAANPWLATEARKHSQAMATGRVDFGHDGFNQRFSDAHKVLHVGSLGENVAYDYRSRGDVVELVMQRWMDSTVHRENILGNYNVIGIGMWPGNDGKVYFTQLFAHLEPQAAEPVSVPRASPFSRKGF